MVGHMGAPGINAEALYRAYEEAVEKYRLARLKLRTTLHPTPEQILHAEDARVILFAAKRAYYEAVLPAKKDKL